MNENTPGRTWATVVHTYPIQVTAAGDTRKSTMLAHWTEADPAAVALALADPWHGDVVEWLVSRDLFTAAHMPGFAGELVGLGHVKVLYDGGLTQLTLTSPDGHCIVGIYGELFVDFLRECAALVPFGSLDESEIYGAAIDREYAELCGAA